MKQELESQTKIYYASKFWNQIILCCILIPDEMYSDTDNKMPKLCCIVNKQ